MSYLGQPHCQARNASNAVTREYFAEGEYVPGSPAQPYYYGPDQIGSVRRVFASAASAPAYSYDPYGNALQGTAPLTDFNYAGMFYNADSGLYLRQYRAYDPVSGRWLSRDPIEETNDQPSFQDSTISTFAAASPRWNALSAADTILSPASKERYSLANRYAYVGGNPVSQNDPKGEQWQWGPVAVGIGVVALINLERFWYDIHPPSLPPPVPPPPEPNDVCTSAHPEGVSPAEVRNYTPRPAPEPEPPEPPDPPEWPPLP
jgi:RHS repeat-associated protein